MCEPLDIFGLSERVLSAYQMCFNANIVSMKEQSHTPHANQGYNHLVSKQDKKEIVETCASHQCASLEENKGVCIGQGALVHTDIPFPKQLRHRYGYNFTAA